MSLQQIKDAIPKQIIHMTTSNITLKDAINKFHPRDKEYTDAKFDEDYIEHCRTVTRFHIPEHQRYYVWTPAQEIRLIDTILNNYPIPDIIVSDTDVRGVQAMEDGQQRFTASWRFCNNLFPYIPDKYIGHADAPHIYYSELPQNHPPNSYILSEIDPDAKRQFDSYNITIKEIKIDESDSDRTSIISEIFERLNSGKPLTDGDKIWNRKETIIVRGAIQIGQDIELRSYFRNLLKIDITKIIMSKKKISKSPLCTMTAIVLGLSVIYNEDVETTSSEHWANILTTSFPKVCEHLNQPNINIAYIKRAIVAICDSIANADTLDGGRKLEAKENKSLNRHLGIMIYDWRKRFPDTSADIEDTEVEKFKDFWNSVIEYFQSFPFELDNRDHPITSLYVDGDRKSKNTDIGKNIQSRHRELIRVSNTWGIEY
jgi:hypothetical protein